MPYGSVRDLPTYIENDRLLQSMRWYRWLLPKEVRDELSDLQRGLERMAGTIDSFYELLGPRNWVFHDSMSVDAMSDIVESHHADAEVAEGALIDWYQEHGHLTSRVVHIKRTTWFTKLLYRSPRGRSFVFGGGRRWRRGLGEWCSRTMRLPAGTMWPLLGCFRAGAIAVGVLGVLLLGVAGAFPLRGRVGWAGGLD